MGAIVQFSPSCCATKLARIVETAVVGCTAGRCRRAKLVPRMVCRSLRAAVEDSSKIVSEAMAVGLNTMNSHHGWLAVLVLAAVTGDKLMQKGRAKTG